MHSIRLYRTSQGPVAERNGRFVAIARDWDELFNDDALATLLHELCDAAEPDPQLAEACRKPLAPIGTQEVWACGVTYFRSRVARMEESKDAGGGDFYERVYDAARPELFFKATADRVVGHGEAMHLRRDSRWIVPEPELVLAVTRSGRINGYTVGNDLSCRDIEGENPLYLPQAKTFDRCAGLGPCIVVGNEWFTSDRRIALRILRDGKIIASDETTTGQMKRKPEELVAYLFRDNTHRHGAFLMTGTGIVPADDLSLQAGDVVDIEIDGIGTLSNPMN